MEVSYEATLTYSETLVRQAVFSFWRRTVGVGIFVAMAILGAVLAGLILDGDRSWVAGALAVVIGCGLAFPALIYAVHFRQSMGKFRAMQSPVATLLAEEASLTLSSEAGKSTFRWSGVTEIWRFPQFWLMLFSRSQFITLPLNAIPADMQAFVLKQAASAGAKIR